MQWIIDGHNLIPHVRGLSLSDLDDEQALIDLLIRFCRARRDRALVFFDRAQAGRGGEQKHGAVKAVFVPQPASADAAIASYLRKQGARARNDTLVSSDRMVQASARAQHLQVLSSPDFAARIAAALSAPSAPTAPEKPLSAEEVRMWEQMFKNRPDSKPKTQE
ncbi:MAG TPA: NYN domain-containing protein [Anaerolineaceae bacterium]|jgi:predicted RNA-binding protein with PIN domain|nr:NYN domain-containing protein [Anaerolineaceae bacterium]HPS32035.1 NYN domain-containing protein [Anaerolineaceae bacterium]